MVREASVVKSPQYCLLRRRLHLLLVMRAAPVPVSLGVALLTHNIFHKRHTIGALAQRVSWPFGLGERCDRPTADSQERFYHPYEQARPSRASIPHQVCFHVDAGVVRAQNFLTRLIPKAWPWNRSVAANSPK